MLEYYRTGGSLCDWKFEPSAVSAESADNVITPPKQFADRSNKRKQDSESSSSSKKNKF